MTAAVEQTARPFLEEFDPLPKQEEFIQYWDGEVYYAGGVGSGKTLSGAAKGVLASIMWPGTVGLVGRQSYRALEDTTKKVYLEGDDKPPVLPPDLVAEYSAGENKVVLTNGSEILFRSFQDHSTEKLLSLNLGWFHIDEATETSEKVLLTLLGRLRHPAGPRVGWGTTNPNGHDWVWRRCHPDAPEATQALLIHAPTEENTHLPADYIDRLRRMPREWQKRFVDANFDTASGAIWDEWDRNVHVVDRFVVPDSWARYEALDHGRRNPTAVLWFADDPEGNTVVYDGYYQPGLVPQHATAIKTIRGDRRMPPIIADPSVFAKGHDGRSVADLYRDEGIQLTEANNVVAAGLTRVSQLLTRHPDRVFPDWHQHAGTLGPDGLGAPTLFVVDTPGTLGLRTEIPDYKWRDLSPALEGRLDQPEEPRKKDDHACDALRYGLMARGHNGLADYLKERRAVREAAKQTERRPWER